MFIVRFGARGKLTTQVTRAPRPARPATSPSWPARLRAHLTRDLPASPVATARTTPTSTGYDISPVKDTTTNETL